MNSRNLIPLIPAAAVLAVMLFSHSCANTTQAPTGGPKDTIPPTLVAVSPMPGTLNVPVHKTKLSFTFNEYVTVKDAKSLFLSPPMEKAPRFKLKGKSVIVYFEEEDLLPGTTYTMDVTGAIVDNNESNPFPGYALTFSTGDRIDSMYVTGVVQDCSTLQPVKGATVMLYKDAADSAIFKHRPDAAVKTDAWGFFCLRNVQDTVFRLYALEDLNGNNMYDPETERVAFCDSAVVPSHKVADGVYELYKFDMLDTAACLNRATDYELNLFRGRTSKQMIVNKERLGERTAYVTFLSPFPQIDTVWFKGISPKRVIKQYNQTRDSLVLWINNPKTQPDTLFLNVRYMKSDTTGALVKTTETIKLSKPKVLKSAMKNARKNMKHEDTIAVYKVNSAPEDFEQYGISLAFDYPLVKESFDSIRYEITNPRQKVEKGTYTWYRDTADIKLYHILHQGKILPGYEYKFTVPERKFRDINGFYNDSTVVSVKLPDDDKLSSMTVELKGVGSNHYIVDMMNEKKNDVIRSYLVKEDSSLMFPYLKEGKYCIRIIEDKNHNNMVDTGDLLTHKQPEKVRFFKLKDGDSMIDIPPSTELVQEIDVSQMFAD